MRRVTPAKLFNKSVPHIVWPLRDLKNHWLVRNRLIYRRSNNPQASIGLKTVFGRCHRGVCATRRSRSEKRIASRQEHFCVLQTKAPRGGLSCSRMRAASAPPEDEVFETNSREAGRRRFSGFRR